MKKLVAVANCRHVRDLLRAVPGSERRPLVCGAGCDRVRLSLHRRHARRQDERARRADQRRLPVALRALLRLLVLSQARRPARPDHRYQTQIGGAWHDERRRPAPRALVVAKTIKQTGMLAENEVIAGTVGKFNFRGLLKIMPLGLRMAAKGKIPPLIMPPGPTRSPKSGRSSKPWRSPSHHDRRHHRHASGQGPLEIRPNEALRLLPRLRRQRVVHGAVQLDPAARRPARHRARGVNRSVVLWGVRSQRRQSRRCPRAERAHLRAG